MNDEITDVIDMLFAQAQMRFGNLIRSHWVYDRDDCPGCGQKISTMKFKKKNALSLNTFIYRDHGVLIAYLLCGKCVKYIFDRSHEDPNTQTELHDKIEVSLKKGYISTLGH